jgi:fructoselysine 6-kinase
VRVVCVGDCGIDYYLPSGERLVGGITANFARHARDRFPANDSICIVSCTGNDADGDAILDALRTTEIDLDITRLDGSTPVQTIEVQPDGERLFTAYDTGVLADFRFSDKQRAAIAGSELLVAPVYLQIVGLFDALMAIETRGIVAVDFADFLDHPDYALVEQHIEHIDIGFFGLQADRDLSPLRAIARANDKTFIVTLGSSGSIALSPDGDVECPAAPVDGVVDTTGAGDAFAAGFLARYCHGADLPVAMARGAAIAADVITRHGAY